MPLLISQPLTEEYYETSRPSVVIEERPQSITIKSSRPQSITIRPRSTLNSASIASTSSSSSSSSASSSPSSPQRNSRDTATTSPRSARFARSFSSAQASSKALSLIHSPYARSVSASIMETATNPARIVVGVDWGTTYSGVAIVHSDNPEDVDIIKSWPGSNSISSDKVPSEMSYDSLPVSKSIKLASTTSLPSPPITPRSSEGGLEALNRPSARWGFQIKPEERRLRCLKLFLDRNQQLPNYVSPLETANQLKKSDRTVMDAVTDYLAQIRKHSMDTLSRRYGAGFEAHAKVEFVLTVPAVWSDVAKNATLLAAESAGMGSRQDLKLISEPEAAALYTLKTHLPPSFEVGHNIIVCDAGGGTVDIIAYRVVQLSPLRIEESAVGTGSLCGSSFINFRFEDHVRERLGEELYNILREKKIKSWQTGLRYFEETVKRTFSDDSEDAQQDFSVPFPGLADNEDIGLEDGFLSLSRQQVKDIFDPVVDQVIGLLQSQVSGVHAKDERVAAVILVGGFGQSHYLYTRLQRHFVQQYPSHVQPIASNPEDTRYSFTASSVYSFDPANTKDHPPRPQQQSPMHIQIIQPPHAWTAVSRGAALRGLEPSSIVSARRARFHYGTSYATAWDPAKHPIADRYWSPLWERWMVADRMQWHISKGQTLATSDPVAFHYTRNFQWGSPLLVEDELLACEEDVAPDVFEEGGPVRAVCALVTDLSGVPKECFTRHETVGGVVFDRLEFCLEMVAEGGGVLGFVLRVGGMRLGGVTAEFR